MAHPLYEPRLELDREDPGVWLIFDVLCRGLRGGLGLPERPSHASLLF
jgi:hypothetical protein